MPKNLTVRDAVGYCFIATIFASTACSIATKIAETRKNNRQMQQCKPSASRAKKN